MGGLLEHPYFPTEAFSESIEEKAIAAVQSIQVAAAEAEATIMNAKAVPIEQSTQRKSSETEFCERVFSEVIKESKRESIKGPATFVDFLVNKKLINDILSNIKEKFPKSFFQWLKDDANSISKFLLDNEVNNDIKDNNITISINKSNIGLSINFNKDVIKQIEIIYFNKNLNSNEIISELNLILDKFDKIFSI